MEDYLGRTQGEKNSTPGKALGRKSEGFLCNVLETKASESSLKDIPIVQAFPDVLPKEILSIPPPTEVEFCIDLIPGATLSPNPLQNDPGSA